MKPAVDHIRHALFGVVVLIIIIFAAPIFARIIGLEYPDSLRPTSIFATMSEISAHLFGGSTTSLERTTDPTTGTVGTDFTNL